MLVLSRTGVLFRERQERDQRSSFSHATLTARLLLPSLPLSPGLGEVGGGSVPAEQRQRRRGGGEEGRAEETRRSEKGRAAISEMRYLRPFNGGGGGGGAPFLFFIRFPRARRSESGGATSCLICTVKFRSHGLATTSSVSY